MDTPHLKMVVNEEENGCRFDYPERKQDAHTTCVVNRLPWKGCWSCFFPVNYPIHQHALALEVIQLFYLTVIRTIFYLV